MASLQESLRLAAQQSLAGPRLGLRHTAQLHAAPAAAARLCSRRRLACIAGAFSDDGQSQGAAAGPPPHLRRMPPPAAGLVSASTAAGRQAAYSLLLDPVLSILACDPDSHPATALVRALLKSDDPSALARGLASEMDERLFHTIKHCWMMAGSVFRTTPRGGPEDRTYYAAMVMLDACWAAAAEARATATEPELSLLKRLMNAWSPEERLRLLSPPEAAQALTSHGGLFFSLLDQEWQKCAQQDAWGDSFLEGVKAERLAKLASIRCEARLRVTDSA